MQPPELARQDTGVDEFLVVFAHGFEELD